MSTMSMSEVILDVDGPGEANCPGEAIIKVDQGDVEPILNVSVLATCVCECLSLCAE